MYIKPHSISRETLDGETLRRDKTSCQICGYGGVGHKAVYLPAMFCDRFYYVPFIAATRIYKQVAMSRGGYSGKGIFGALSYIVVEYDGGQTRRFRFKHEEYADQLLNVVKERCPSMWTTSKEAQARLDEAEALENAKKKSSLSEEARHSIRQLDRAKEYLEEKPAYYHELAAASKAKRVNDLSNPAYKWFGLVIVIAAAVLAAFGLWSILTHTGTMGIYFILFGAVFIFLLVGANLVPTKKNNKEAITERLLAARRAMQAYLNGYGTFPVPVKYAHPMTLRRMKREIEEGRAETMKEAFELLKTDLKAVNHTVTVSQMEYDEITAIKPMFLIEDYRD
jgi:hypothetical protein